MFGLCLVPIVGVVAGGHWGQGPAGIATVGALLTGGEIVRGVRERIRR